MNETALVDDFGRRTVFTGEHLLYDSTDSTRNDKPQWVEVDVWRTAAGSFVVRRITRYRVRHLREDCERADGYDLSPATPEDTYPCRSCNTYGEISGGWGQDDRINVDVYTTPQGLILGFQHDGKFNALSRSILAGVAEHDAGVDAAWNTVVVP